MTNIPDKIAKLELALQSAVSGKDKVSKLNKLATLYKDMDTERGLVYINQSLVLCKELNLQEELAQSYGILGVLYIRQNALAKALSAHNKQLSLLNAIGIAHEYPGTYTHIGIINMQRGHYQMALKYFYQSLAIHESKNHIKGAAVNYSNIAQIFGLQKNHKEALHFYLKALDLYKQLDDPMHYLGMTYTNVGAEYIYMEKFDEALSYLKKALNILEELQHGYGLTLTLHCMGVIFSEKFKFNKALTFFRRSLKKSLNLKNTDLVAHNYIRMAEVYSKTDNYEKAIAFNRKCLTLKKHLANSTIDNIYSELTRNYAAIGKYRKAYQYQTEYLKRMEKLFDESKNLALVKIRTQYETEKKEREAQEYKLQNTTLRLEALRSKMNPHFIFNALTSIQNLILKEAHHEALIYISDFSTMVRKALDTSDKNYIPLQEELDFLKYYIELETLRFKTKFSYQINIGEQIASNSTYVPSMLIQPYVENAIKHGLWHKKIDGKLSIDLALNNNNTLICTIEDNGIGREKARQFAKSRIHQSKGMKITSQRLELLNTTLDQPVKVNIIDLHDKNQVASGTKVVIIIPIETE
ncbi:MAG: tetratricopeptide repeat-containing sensor histidine kinase [Chitinophagales bacterium]